MPERTDRTLEAVRQQYDPQFEYVQTDFVPWTHLVRPISGCKLALVSTAGVYLKNQFHAPFDAADPQGDPSFREFPANVAAEDLLIAHAHYDHRHAALDMNVVFPIDRLRELARMGAIGQVAPFCYSFMGFITRPGRLLADAVPNLVVRLRHMQPDAVLLTAASPVCHQSAALIARSIEAAGIPTLVVGIYPEFWALTRPPRAVWMRHPPGATFGAPGNVGKQQQMLRDVLDAFAEMQDPGAVIQLPYQWQPREG